MMTRRIMALLSNTKTVGQAKLRQEISPTGIGAIYGSTDLGFAGLGFVQRSLIRDRVSWLPVTVADLDRPPVWLVVMFVDGQISKAIPPPLTISGLALRFGCFAFLGFYLFSLSRIPFFLLSSGNVVIVQRQE